MILKDRDAKWLTLGLFCRTGYMQGWKSLLDCNIIHVKLKKMSLFNMFQDSAN